jgi:hypothetical protein
MIYSIVGVATYGLSQYISKDQWIGSVSDIQLGYNVHTKPILQGICFFISSVHTEKVDRNILKNCAMIRSRVGVSTYVNHQTNFKRNIYPSIFGLDHTDKLEPMIWLIVGVAT